MDAFLPQPPPLPSAHPRERVPIADLKPLRIGEMLDLTFRLYRRHFIKLLLIALLLYSLIFLFGALSQYLNGAGLMPLLQDPPSTANLVTLMKTQAAVGLIWLICLLVTESCTGVTAAYASEVYLGRHPEIGEGFTRLRERLLPLLLTNVLRCLLLGLSLLPCLIGIAGMAYGYHEGLLWVMLLALVATLFLLIPFLVLYVRYILCTHVVILEPLSGWKALQRSSELTRYNPGLGFWYWGATRISVLLFLLFVVQLLVVAVSGIPVGTSHISDISRGVITDRIFSFSPVVVLTHVLSYLGGSLMAPLYAISLMLFYYDIRIRKEGFDLEFMSRAMAAVHPPRETP